MVAVAHLPPVHDRRRVVVVRSAPVLRPRPTAAPPHRIYRRRRTLALLAATTVVLALSLAVQAAMGATATGAAATGAPGAATGATSPVYVVRPGDTFWDIARMLRPDGDPRPVVARLVAVHGSPVLRVGERITLPAAD